MIAIQPFANIVRYYTCYDSLYKRDTYDFHPLSTKLVKGDSGFILLPKYGNVNKEEKYACMQDCCINRVFVERDRKD